jgi:hypothetical protein
MDTARLPEIIREVYRLIDELETMFKGWHFTPDGHSPFVERKDQYDEHVFSLAKLGKRSCQKESPACMLAPSAAGRGSGMPCDAGR